MADSEDEVDVEDISEGEHLSKLRVSAVEDQKDNWYEKHIGNQSFLNHSDNSFSSDYCDPNSWLLDSNSVWSLDPCTDDKSRATIEKMILEEQMYVYRSASRKLEKSTVGDKRKQTGVGRSTSPKVKKQITKTAKETSVTHRKPWTVEEQEQFEQGLNVYGRSWTKIAAMISSRTSLQVKNYANQYFKQKNKNPAKMENCPVKATQLSCLESSCASNLEHVGAGGSGSKDEQMKEAIHCVKLSESIADETPDCESDDDIEVNIDGSDSDEAGDQLMPGQTTSCPETVYSALIRAAAENPQDLITDETKSFSSDANDIAVSPEENSSYLEQYSESDVSQGISVIVDDKLTIETPISLSEVEIMSMDTGDLSCFSSFGEQDSSVDTSTLREGSSLNEIPEENHVAQEDEDRIDHEQQYCQNAAVLSPGDDSQKADIAVCNSVPTEVSSSLVQRHNDECVKFPRLDSATQMSTSACDEVKEKEWTLVSCGDVTSCESIPAADREQPEASFNVSGATACERVVIDRLNVQYVEKDQNSEFFMGRALKTPERYMKIRNYILDMWEKNKPNYLFKTAVRAGLRNCGDVNSIGRVHAFLEDIGAINEGCFDRPVPRVRQQGEAPSDDKEDVHMESWVNFLRPRRKRQRIKEGDWVDINDSEGMTIQHLSPEEAVEQGRTSVEKTSPSPPRKRSSRSKPSYDPFLLVPCRKFPSCSAVPFDVRIQSEALVVMDAHAHLSTTEVIGLLGGEYFYESRTLKVSKAIPCRSLSTGLQCEMDPVSQTQASEELAGRGLAVVGWYHSHPTFAPIPSVRDIETQAKFQEWFGKGGAPFIGIIVSPYNYSNPSSQSQIRCLTVGEEWDAAGQYRLPYQFDYEVLSDVTEEDDTVEQVRGIADDYRRYPFRVQLNRRFGNSANFTMLDKLADSLRARLKTSDDERDAFLERLIEVIAANFKLQTPLQECRHDELSYDVEDNEAGATGEDSKSEPGNSDVTR